MIENQSKQPFRATPAKLSSGKWVAQIYSGDNKQIGHAYGTSEAQCNANAQCSVLGGNGLPVSLADQPLFPNSFWCEKKRRTVMPNSPELVADLFKQFTSVPSTMNTINFSTPLNIVNDKTPRFQLHIVKDKVVRPAWSLHKQMWDVSINNDFPSGGDDGHTCFLNPVTGRCDEAIKFIKTYDGYQAEWGGRIENMYTSDGVVPLGPNGEFHGATATSLPVAAGMVLLREAKAGIIPHMLAFAIQNPSKLHKAPALRGDEDAATKNTGLIDYGQIFQFPIDIFIDPALPILLQMMIAAIRDYGMILRDRAGCVVVYGEDITQFGKGDHWAIFRGGMGPSEMMKMLPANLLQAVEF